MIASCQDLCLFENSSYENYNEAELLPVLLFFLNLKNCTFRLIGIKNSLMPVALLAGFCRQQPCSFAYVFLI